MTALLLAALVACALGGIVAGLRIARWAAVERACDIYGARRRAEDRASYAFQRLDIAREDAARWRRCALRLGWRPRVQRPGVVDARRGR